MKRSIVTTALLAVATLVPLCSPRLAAQTDYRSKSSNMLSIGLGLAGGASMILDPPEGQKVKPIFAWRGNVDVTYPISRTIASMLSLGLDKRGFRLHAQNDKDLYADTRVSYFSIYPAFRFSTFTLGVNFGLPMGGTITSPTSGGAETTKDLDAATEDRLETLIEPRLGANVILMDTDLGWLGLTIGAGISVGEMFTPIEVNSIPGLPEPDYGDFHSVSLHIGATWQFGIKGTGQR